MVYSTVKRVTWWIMQLGEGTLIAKVDIEAAYRLVPVQAQDCPLLEVRWEGPIYLDAMLPFGLQSAPKYSMWWLSPSGGYFSNNEGIS